MSSDVRFPICTPVAPAMVGRSAIIEQVVQELTRQKSIHRSIVGARFIGKSVFLKELAGRIRQLPDHYCAVIEWDLGHLTPRDDSEFLSQMCNVLANGLIDAGLSDEGEHLRSVAEDHYAEMSMVIESIQSEGGKVLMLFDGFDKPLESGLLTRNLWDNLRELCLKEAFRLVTATRRELHDLIRDEKSVTSDFWNIFGDLVRLGPFDQEDISAVLAELEGLDFKAGARTELANWSGASPPLLLCLINRVEELKTSGTITNQTVNDAAKLAQGDLKPVLDRSWSDCSPTSQDLYQHLLGQSEGISEYAHSDANELLEKGFGTKSGNRLHVGCRLLSQTLEASGAGSGSIASLFTDIEAYQHNIVVVLQRRLAHVGRFNPRLHRFVEIAIGQLSQDAESALNNLTSIEERALDEVWGRESEDGSLPNKVVNEWTKPKYADNRIFADMMRANDFSIPNDRYKQLGLLQQLTGSHRDFESMSRVTSKDVYVLLSAIHTFRNRSQHADGQEIDFGFAVSALMTCVELLCCLDRESSN
jgi:hypothetical protein